MSNGLRFTPSNNQGGTHCIQTLYTEDLKAKKSCFDPTTKNFFKQMK